MLTTKELKEYIFNQVNRIVDDASSDNVELQTRFCVGKAESYEGTYAFTQDESYHYLLTEKGKIRFDKVTFELNEVTYWILETEIFTIAMRFATENRVEGKDFRRQLFVKELELHSRLGDYFYSKKKRQIEEILVENPYIDKR